MSSKDEACVPTCLALPKLSEIINILKPMEDKWHELGVQLDIESDQLKRIEGDYQQTSRRFSETIIYWQNKLDPIPSRSALADAVERVRGHDKLARELRACDSISNQLQYHCSRRSQSSEDTGYSSKNNSATCGDSSGSETDCNQPRHHDGADNPEDADSKSNLVSGDSPITETENFFRISGCGCGKCSISTLISKECPNTTKTKVGIVSRQVEDQGVLLPSEDEEQEAKEKAEKYRRQTRQMRSDFAAFVNKICKSFKSRNLTQDEIILYAQNAIPELKPRIEEMAKATNMEQLFTIITARTCSWFDCDVLKDMIGCFGNDHDKMELDQYEAKVKKFIKERLPERMKHIKVGSGAEEGYKQVVIKVDKEWDEVNIDDIDKIREHLASILGPNVRSRDLYLADIREGCIRITFMVTEELAESLFPGKDCLTPSQISSLKDKGIISLKCGKFCWRSLPIGDQEVSVVVTPELEHHKVIND